MRKAIGFACTATVIPVFGSKVVIPGTGVIMNDQMDDFFDPARASLITLALMALMSEFGCAGASALSRA